MTAPELTALEDLPLDVLQEIDRRCERFEAGWRGGRAPAVEEYLAGLAAVGRRPLLKELLSLELVYRRKRGEEPAREDFLRRFPGDADLVNVLWRETDTTAGARARTAAPDREAAPTPWPTVPGYEIVRELGRGGMGVVYLARHLRLNRQVALKMIAGGLHAETGQRERFQSEAEALARLQHPNIVQIFEVGESHGRPFLALEFADGGSLAQRLDGTPHAPREAAQLVETLARAVRAAHQCGIIHRDLKPANVLLSFSGRSQSGAESAPLCERPLNEAIPKIGDFGLARRVEGDDRQSQSGSIVGSPRYMAPEQAGGSDARIGPAADVHALGVLLYELLTGRPPFHAATVLDTLEQVRSHEPIVPGRLQPRLPRSLQTICLKCLAKDPGQRYASALALADDLGRFLRGEPILARPTPPWQRGVLWARRQPWLAALVLAVLATTAAALASLAWALVAARERADVERRGAAAESARADLEKSARETESDLRREAERTLNENRIALAAREWEANNVVAAEALLEQCRPRRDQPDLRGWEWYYLRRLCRGDLLRLGHRYWVNDVAFSPDGHLLATAAGSPGRGIGDPQREGELCLWDATTGQPLATLLGGKQPTPQVSGVAFSPDGRWLLAWDGAADWHLWEVNGRRRRGTRHAVAAAFLPDGRTLALVGTDGALTHLDLTTGGARAVRAAPPPHSDRLARAAFGAGNRRLALRPAGGEAVTILDSASGRELRSLVAEEAGHPLLLSPDGRWLLEAARLWDAETGQSSPELDPAIVRPVFSPDSKWLAWANKVEGVLTACDTPTQQRPLRGHDGVINRVLFSPDSRRLATAGTDTTARLWDVLNGEPTGILRGHTSGVRGLAFSPDGRKLASAGQDQSARAWDATRDPRGLVLRGPHPWGEYLGNFSFARDGEDVGLVRLDEHPCRLLKQDLTDGAAKELGPLDYPQRLDAPRCDSAFTRDGRRLAALCQSDARLVKVWDGDTGREVQALRGHAGPVRCVAISDDGRRVASLAPLESDAETIIWDPGTGQALRTLRAPPAHCLALSRDGRLLAAGGTDGCVRVWEADTGREVFASASRGRLAALAFSPDGRWLAAAEREGLSVREVATGNLRHFLPASSRRLSCVTFSPDGRPIAAVGYDEGTVHLWDADTGHDLLALRGFARWRPDEYTYLARVVFSPDGRRIASNNWDNTINVWDAGSPDD